MITLLAALLWLDSGGGQRWLVQQLASRTTQTGISLKIGRVEGSLYHKARLHDVELRDAQGAFLHVPQANLVWRPLSLLRNQLIIDTLTIDQAQLMRTPVLKRPDKDDQLWPDMDIDIRSFALKRMTFGNRPSSTQAQSPQLEGLGRVLLTKAQADIRLVFNTADNEDTLRLTLVSDPAQDRFALSSMLALSREGELARKLELPYSLSLLADGQGTYQNWLGTLSLALDGMPLAKFDLVLRQGIMNLAGRFTQNASLSMRMREIAEALPKLSGQIDIGKRPAHIKIKAYGPSATLIATGKYDRLQARIPEGRVTISDPRCLIIQALHRDIGCTGLGLDGQISGPLHHLGYRLRLTAERMRFNLPNLGTVQSNRLHMVLANRPNPLDTLDITLKASNLQSLAPHMTGNWLADYTQGLSLTTTLVPTRTHWEFTPMLIKSKNTTLLGNARLAKKNHAFDAFFKAGRLTLVGSAVQGLPIALNTRFSWRPDDAPTLYFDAIPLLLQWNIAQKTPIQNTLSFIERATGTVRFKPDAVKLDQIDLTTKLGRFAGSLACAKEKLTGMLTGEVRALEKFSPALGYSGTLPLRMRISGTLHAPIVTADTLIERLAFMGQTLRQAAITILPFDQSRFKATLRASSDLGLLSLRAMLSFLDNAIRFDSIDGQLGRYLLKGSLVTSYAQKTYQPPKRAGQNPKKTNRWQGTFTIALPRQQGRQPQQRLQARIDFDHQAFQHRYVIAIDAQNLTQDWRNHSYTFARLAAKGQTIINAPDGRLTDWQWQGQLNLEGFKKSNKTQTVLTFDQMRLQGRIGTQQKTKKSGSQEHLGARLFLAGRKPAPYQLQATLKTYGAASGINHFILTSLQGTINGERIRALRPVEGVRHGSHAQPFWQLTQTLLQAGAGAARVQGTWRSGGYQAQMGLRDIPSELFLKPFAIPFQGALSGQMRLESTPQQGLTMLEAQLNAGPLLIRSSLSAAQFTFTALYNKNSQIIGEMMLTAPKPNARSLLQSPLAGNWRWNGPLQDLVPMIKPLKIPLSGQFVAGVLTTRGHVSGVLASPNLSGQIQLDQGRWRPKGASPDIEDIKITGRFSQKDIMLERIMATLPSNARLQARGRLGLSPQQGYPLELDGQVDAFTIAPHPGVLFKPAGNFTYQSANGQGQLSARLALSNSSMRMNPIRLAQANPKTDTAMLNLLSDATNLNLNFTTAQPLLLETANSSARWLGTLTIAGTMARPRYNGFFQLEDGQLRFGRTRMRLTAGTARFEQSADFLPILALRAQARVRNGTAYAIFNGSKNASSWQFLHDPNLSEEAILARLLYDDLPRSVPPEGQRAIEAALALARSGLQPNKPTDDLPTNGAPVPHSLLAPLMPFLALQKIADTGRPNP